MSEASALPSVDPGLLARFRSAGAKITWRDALSTAARSPRRVSRIAHLHDEEARVEVTGRGTRTRIAVESGPVGALVLLLEIDGRGPPSALGASEAGHEPGFPGGAIVAAWGGASVPHDSSPTLSDLVELARYSLA